MIIVGISGKKKSGKNTFANFLECDLQSRGLIVKQYAFADVLKLEVAIATGMPLADIDINKDVFRPILQWWGHDFRRKYQGRDNYWVNRLAEKLSEDKYAVDVAIVTDVRYPNEAEFIRKMNGHLIRINRTLTGDDQHSSEIGLDTFTDWDFTYDNNGTLAELKEKSWPTACYVFRGPNQILSRSQDSAVDNPST